VSEYSRTLIPGSYTFWEYEDLIYLGGALLPSMLLGMLISGAATRALHVDKGIAGFIMQFVAYAGWFVALWMIFRQRYGKPFWSSLGWNLQAVQLPVAFLTGIALSAALIFLSAFLDKPAGESPMQELLSRESTLFLVGIFSITVGPLCEELAFRGFLMPLLARTFGVAGGIVLAAVPFAVAHAPQYAWSWRHVALIGLAGICFGWARFRTGSTAAATVMHGAYNATIFAGLLYEKYQW